MYIQRISAIIRPGCMEEAAEMVKKEIEYSHANGRVLTPIFGSLDVLQLELRVDTLAEYEKFWADWASLPTTPAFNENWPKVSLRGGSNELWEVQKPVVVPDGKIVNRITFKIQGKIEDVVGLLDAERQAVYPFEITIPTFGANDIVITDFPFENLSAREQFWSDWTASERSGPFFEKWFPLITAGGTNEIWEVR